MRYLPNITRPWVDRFKARATLNRFGLSTQINCHQGHIATYSLGWNRVTPSQSGMGIIH